MPIFKLPRTQEDFDRIVNQVHREGEFENKDHTAAICANRIMHTAIDQDDITSEYLTKCVHRNLAYQFAANAGQRATHKFQIDDIMAQLKIDPNNQQAWDALTKAANEGSAYAKAQLETLAPTPINSLLSGETTESA